MCGIAGYYGLKNIPEERVELCLGRMRRRGPDASGVYRHEAASGRNVLMLHSRLSIIDLDERADQPYAFDPLVLCFNGEIYNYVELRERLKRNGQRFDTTSDTEVLVKLMHEAGEAGLDLCEGMWAFSLFNKESGSLLLSRDRFGEKPLYIFSDEDGLYFGSEPKFIFALMGRQLDLNQAHLMRYLVNGYKSLYKGEDTFYEGLKELPAGHLLEVGASGEQGLRQYWRWSAGQDPDMSFEAAVQGTRERLMRAVELRLRADVPLAFCLSGGIDSCGLIAIARRVFNYDVHGFTISSPDPRYNEDEFVSCMVNELDLRHTVVQTSTDDFLARMRKLVAYHDAPVFTISYYVHWLLMQAVSKAGYKVSVSGTAADELFSGYYDHHLLYLAAVAQDPALYRVAERNWLEHVKPIVRNPYLQDPRRFAEDPDFRGHIYMNAEVFAGYLGTDWREPFSEEPFGPDVLRRRMLNELFREVIPVILHEDDANAMYHSIENRSPYLDRGLFEFSLRIPTRHLVRDGRAKAVLREALRGIVPDKVLDNRRKVGFNAPIFELFDPASAANREWLMQASQDAILKLPDDFPGRHFDGGPLDNSLSKFLFSFISGKLFCEAFQKVGVS